MSTQITPKLTLENIAQRKKKLQGEIQVQKKAMTATVAIYFLLSHRRIIRQTQSCAHSIQEWQYSMV